MSSGVPQGSLLSLILFLFYNAELLQLCSRTKEGMISIRFADDVNLLAYSTSTHLTCRHLERMHLICQEWAKRYGISFAPNKYELIHFTRRRTKFNLQETVHLGETEKSLTESVRVLGV